MRVRTYIGILLAFLGAIAVAYLTHRNTTLLYEPFHLTAQTTVPLWIAFVLLLAVGLLPSTTALLVQNLRRELVARRDRRLGREAESLKAIYRRSVDLQADGQWARSAQELEALLKERPDDFSALLRYGEALRHLARLDEAIEVHRRASVLYPHSVALLYELSEDYEARGDAPVTEELRARILRDFPGMGLQLLRRRRVSAMAARKWDEAARLQESIEGLLREAGDAKALEVESKTGQGLEYQRGVLLLELDRIDEAATRFRELLAREPRFIPAAIMLGEAELLRGDEDAALHEWRQGYDSTGSPVFLQRIEDHFIEREEPARAIETLRGLISTVTNDTLPRFYLGRLYYRLEMHGEALRELEAVGDRILTSPTYHYLVARIHERRGEMRRAVEGYLTCIRQLGLDRADYLCKVCRTRSAEWNDRCDGCGSWNSIELDFEEEHLSPQQLGVRETPVWGPPEESGEFSVAELLKR
ncbi:MAG: tetratricopeptide repeat protein [Acidobacteriota bacterium]